RPDRLIHGRHACRAVRRQIGEQQPIALRVGLESEDPGARRAQPIEQHAVPAEIRADIEGHIVRPEAHVFEQIAGYLRLVRTEAMDVSRDAIRSGPGEGEADPGTGEAEAGEALMWRRAAPRARRARRPADSRDAH